MPLRIRYNLSSLVFLCARTKWEEVLCITQFDGYFLFFFLEQMLDFVLAFSVPYVNDLFKK